MPRFLTILLAVSTLFAATAAVAQEGSDDSKELSIKSPEKIDQSVIGTDSQDDIDERLDALEESEKALRKQGAGGTPSAPDAGMGPGNGSSGSITRDPLPEGGAADGGAGGSVGSGAVTSGGGLD